MKLFFTLCIFILLSGCAVLNYEMSLGASEEEFKKNTYSEVLYELSPERTIYSMVVDHRTTRLVYFEQGKLTKVETVERIPDFYFKQDKSHSN